MEIQVAVAKVNKYGSTESGDTIEFVERPMGGISVVLADARSSGKKAKAVSSLVVRKIISLLAEGVRDGACARAASDYLFTEKNGTATAFLNILSADLETSTIVLTRNSQTPIFIAEGEIINCLSAESSPIGENRGIKPEITEIPLKPGITIVLYTDGIQQAGQEIGLSIDICTNLEAILEEQEPTAQEVADSILSEAIRLDMNRPNDDMSVIVMTVVPKEHDMIRRMTVQLPVPQKTSIFLD